jgi:ribulose 1,5-bisphosphate carboxylase large subunit-like protein
MHSCFGDIRTEQRAEQTTTTTAAPETEERQKDVSIEYSPSDNVIELSVTALNPNYIIFNIYVLVVAKGISIVDIRGPRT